MTQQLVHHRRTLVGAAVVAVALAVSALIATTALSARRAPQRIAAQQAVVTVTPVRPYQPGDQVWTASAPAVAEFATGCQRIPPTGYLGTNAYAQTTAEYANRWDWSSASSNQSFAWWIKKTDGTIEASGTSSGAGGGRTLAANIYYWRVQNQGGSPQAWNVCYDVI